MRKEALALLQDCEVAREELFSHELKQMQFENIQCISANNKAVHGGHCSPSAHLKGRNMERAVSE